MLFEVGQNEEELIDKFLNQVLMIDPDVIIGYDLYSCEMEILLDRVKVLRVKEGNRLGRLKRVKEQMDKDKKKVRYLSAGRLLCDIYESSREYLPGLSDYSLSNLCASQLNIILPSLLEDDLLILLDNPTNPNILKLLLNSN